MRNPIPTLTAVAIATLLAGQAQAEDVSLHELCKGRATLAETAFDARASGVPLHEMLDVTQDSAMATLIVRLVFTYPEYHSREMQQRSRREVADDIYNSCLTNLED